MIDHILPLLQGRTALDLSQAAVARAVRHRMKQCHTTDFSSYTQKVMTESDELDALIDLVVVPETWFFRDEEAFAAARTFLCDLLAHKPTRPLRILSAPCATGEEPYSLAIALLDAGVAGTDFLIDAIDISSAAIERAKRAVYAGYAFRTRDLLFRERHFIRHNDAFELMPRIRAQVGFQQRSLLAFDSGCDAPYDVIFCRNLLIYFNEPTQRSAIAKLRSLLHEEGMLFCGYAEMTMFCRHGFAMAPYAKAFALRKQIAIERPFHHVPASRKAAKKKPVPKTALAIPPLPLRPTARPKDMHADSADTLLQQAKRQADKGETEAACASYLAHLQSSPDSAEAYFMMGLLREKTGDDTAAEACLRRAIYLEPDHYEALCHLALLLERAGNSSGAASIRQRAARVFARQPGKRSEG